MVTTLKFSRSALSTAFGGLTLLRNCETLYRNMPTFFESGNVEDSKADAPLRPRRRWERHNVSILVNVATFLNNRQHNFRAEACDISRGGMRLFLTRELEPGASIQLEFLMPYHGANLVLRGVIRNRSGFSHGVEFISPAPYQQQLIERTCKVLGLLR